MSSHATLPTAPNPCSENLMRRFEAVEAEAWGDFHRSAPADLADELGIDALALDGGLLAVAAGLDVLALNRAVGLGLSGAELDHRVLDRVEEVYRSRGVRRFFLQASPLASPDGLVDELVRRAGRPYNHWIRLARRAEPVAEPSGSLIVRPIGPERASDFGRIFAEAFGWPAAGPWVAATVGRPGWRHYLAWDGSRPVATGALYRSGDVAWLDLAGTLPSHRGRGAQSALLARRVTAAADLGCSWATLETADHHEDGRPSASFRNARRADFLPLYRRPNYLFEEPSLSGRS